MNNYIKRNIETILLKNSQSFPVIMITGPRQVGKTTLLNFISKNIEIKKSKNPGKDAIKNFDVVKKFGVEVSKGIVLCMCDEVFPLDSQNYLVPIELI